VIALNWVRGAKGRGSEAIAHHDLRGGRDWAGFYSLGGWSFNTYDS
jgi:hypothetical protein